MQEDNIVREDYRQLEEEEQEEDEEYNDNYRWPNGCLRSSCQAAGRKL